MSSKTDNNIQETMEMMQEAYYFIPEHDPETGDVTMRSPAPPKFKSVYKLKRKHADYRQGPVKIYTKAEIAEYERERANDKSN